MAGKLSLLLVFLASVAHAGPPASAAELARWRAAVMTDDAAAIAALVEAGQSLEITSGGHEPLTLDRDALRARLDAGEADALGLSSHLLLPTRRDLRPVGTPDLRRVGKRYEASRRQCPEVVWVFERSLHGRVRLVAIRRVFLEC